MIDLFRVEIYDKPVCEFIQDHIPLFSQNLGGPV